MKDDCSCAKARVLPVKHFLDEGIWYDDNHDDNQSTDFPLIGQGILHMRRSSYFTRGNASMLSPPRTCEGCEGVLGFLSA